MPITGYDTRPSYFPQSVILCGVRDVRDYRIHSDEERVRRVILPMLLGDDIEYLIDLGLIRKSPSGLIIANSIYREVIPRELTQVTQYNLEPRFDPLKYILSDGKLDIQKLLSAFQAFFREHSEHWVERFQYKEAGPQLLLQAFLQRIVNSGGRVEREYGLGCGRTDLMVIWFYASQVQKVVIELKILYKFLEATMNEGLEQTWGYMNKCGTADGHLVIFDRSEKSWGEKIFRRTGTFKDAEIVVWGM